jgi:hypothetical protein
MEAWPAGRDRTIALLLARPATSPADTQTPEQRTPKVWSTEVQTPEAVRPKGMRQAAAPAPAEVLRLERKELLTWPDQISQLSILARVLNGNRGGADNHEHTYPRAAALLLSRSQGLGSDGRKNSARRTPGLTDFGFPEFQKDYPPAAGNALTTTSPAPPRLARR